jgi:mono/diheme cytochrome c family protein
MNQLKYVLDACLMVAMGLMAIYLYQAFPSGNSEPEDFFPNSKTMAVTVSKGQRSFRQQCGGCHAMDRDLVGPALNGVGKRGPWAENRENLKKWLKDPEGFMATSSYARALKEKYKVPMSSFRHLSEEETEAIIGYITQGQ